MSRHQPPPDETLEQTTDSAANVEETQLLNDIRILIRQARERLAVAVNAELTLLYWHIGERLYKEVLQEQRAEYGQHMVATVSRHLTTEFGKGFTRDNLLRMIQFVQRFPEAQIVGTLSRQLSWSHFVEILPVEDATKRAFYVEMCRLHQWSVRGLKERMQGMLYERTALSKKPEEVIRQELTALRDEDRMTPDMVFRNPYVLTGLGLPDVFSEADLENAVLREIEAFLLELGDGFAFLARQKRMVIDGKDFKLDLLLYHRKLHRLVAIELKLGEFEPAYKGQMELYLRWLDRYEREREEEAPIGLILCEKAGPEQVSLLQLDQGDIRVAEYLTQHLPPPLLEQKLREALRHSREQLATREEPPALSAGEEPEQETEGLE